EEERVEEPRPAGAASAAGALADGLRRDDQEDRALRRRTARHALCRHVGLRLRDPHLGRAEARRLPVSTVRACALAPAEERQDRAAGGRRLYLVDGVPGDAVSTAA